MATLPRYQSAQKLVNNQYNSPIKLYSEKNIQNVIERESQILKNGVVGINFNEPTRKPGNLGNSAVLKMLEEEERQKRNGVTKVAWPPSREDQLYSSVLHDPTSPVVNFETDPNHFPTTKPHYPPHNSTELNQLHLNGESERRPIANGHGIEQESFGPKSCAKQPSPSPASNYSTAPLTRPSQIYPPSLSKGPSPAVPGTVSPALPAEGSSAYYSSPPPFSPSNPSAFVPASPTSIRRYNNSSPAFRVIESPTPQGIITLRKEAPITQEPPPVFASQPATASLQGGINMRGDQKWPPEPYKKQAEAENEARVQLARGPVCRPRRVNRDYSQFFEQHKLNSTYPAYRAPPGTQHFGPGEGSF